MLFTTVICNSLDRPQICYTNSLVHTQLKYVSFKEAGLQRVCKNSKIRPLVVMNTIQPIVLNSLYSAGMQLSADKDDYQLPVLRLWDTDTYEEYFGLG